LRVVASKPRLKVFVTPIGFHDAYVAATSQKAALQAWGADVDLFARGAASLVTDAELAREALASPGTVIKRLRGTEAEHIAAAEQSARPTKKRDRTTDRTRREDTKSEPQATPQPKPKPATGKPAKAPPRPSRKALDDAEAALAVAEERHREAQRVLADRIADLQRERQALRAAEEKEIARLERRRDDARSRYQDAVERWASR